MTTDLFLFKAMHHNPQAGLGAQHPKTSVDFRWEPFHHVFVFGNNLKSVDNEKDLVAVTRSVFFLC